jgi:Leucine-rich repeat (LRR) protein
MSNLSTSPINLNNNSSHFDPFSLLNSTDDNDNSIINNDTINLSYMDLDDLDSHFIQAEEKNIDLSTVTNLLINNNLLKSINPFNLNKFISLQTIDLSFNYIVTIPDELSELKSLKNLILKENLLHNTSFGKNFLQNFQQLEVINLSGNSFTQFPYQLLEMRKLKEIYLGANKIQLLPKNYDYLANSLELLYLGGNLIHNVPEEISQLMRLRTLNLSDNRITRLPTKITKLKNLKSLALHNNFLTTLPIELVKLNLAELSLRNNPLVSRFIRDLNYTVPSLLELCGRVVKTNNICYMNMLLPRNLIYYLNSAHCCVNPKCRGVYFTSKVEHVKFVDFCGKYRVPLMQYLCSPKCDKRMLEPMSSESDDDDVGLLDGGAGNERVDEEKLKRVLLQ